MTNSRAITDIVRRFLPIALWLVVLCLLGGLVAGAFGMLVGLVLAVAWTLCSLAGADRYAVVAHGGRLLNRIEAPNLHDIVDALAGEAGIEPPSLYALPFSDPNVVVSASRRKGQARIGVTNGLALHLERNEVRALLALAIARIAAGEASVISLSTTMAGLPQQFAMSSFVNFTAWGFLWIDPECGLTVIGKGVVVLAAPFSWLTNRICGIAGSCLDTDAAAARFLGEGREIARALEKAAAAIPAPGFGSTTGYNPGTAPAFLVSPFEGTRGVSSDPATQPELIQPLWQKARLWAARQTPPVAVRASALLGRPLQTFDSIEHREPGPRPATEHVTWPPVG